MDGERESLLPFSLSLSRFSALLFQCCILLSLRVVNNMMGANTFTDRNGDCLLISPKQPRILQVAPDAFYLGLISIIWLPSLPPGFKSFATTDVVRLVQ